MTANPTYDKYDISYKSQCYIYNISHKVQCLIYKISVANRNVLYLNSEAFII